VVIYLGIHLAGGIVASMEKNMPEAELINVALKLKAGVLICEMKTMAEFRNGLQVILIDRDTVMDDIKGVNMEGFELMFPKEEDSADILFTTGTTGSSKGVELSHKALTATAENLIYGCGYKKDTVIIVPGPLNHANAIRKLFTTLVNGSTIYILNGMANIRDFFEALDYPEGSISCCLPPAAIRTIFQLTRDRISDYADRIDFIESATSPLPEPDKLKLCELLPNTRLYNNYGSSESASVCMYDYNKYRGKANCIGMAMPNSKIIIVDDDKHVIKSSKNRMGLIACMGAVNMKGYVNEPILTSEVLRDGILYTNDVGYMDDEGFVYVIGRKGDVINVGGFKVAPTEVEAVALESELIDDCICIPVDDRITGKALKLLVVCPQNVEFNAVEIKAFMSRKVESYKVPKYVEKTDKVARTYNGKLDRKAYL
jgi:acyl-CoA synthetase (AMP-forming)/AMP-acid ligase II